MTETPFTKMHGLGNDFVVFDARQQPLPLNPDQIRHIADRRLGVGCDQVVVLEPTQQDEAHVFMRLYNADGGEVAACGNATRCVAEIICTELNQSECTIESAAGLLDATRSDAGITVDMGRMQFDWRDIPLSKPVDTNKVPISVSPEWGTPSALSIGNPHLVFFVLDSEAVDLETHGPLLETHELFPERTNVEVVQILSQDELRLRVWERGVGLTQACGTGACAAAVAAFRRGLCGRQVKTHLPGGTLEIEYLKDGHVMMTGPASTSFKGTVCLTS